ncbi:RNA ligase [Longispora albida]|uniref:RNA ligase n=1 Tax=Longispora albida TaxID=203523 RepID=UPI00037CE712|nr:RNA ligase [Longispora albida]
MLHLDEVVEPTLLKTMIDEGYVRVRQHPGQPYSIYNYSEKAQYESVWNAATLACRGLITDSRTGEVLARPFRKFFTHGQAECGPLDLGAPVTVTDKADGSLGVLFPAGDGYEVATRGSFVSDQALHATRLWQRRYGEVRPPDGVTLLFEIVYPANRIVVDYGDLDDLILLGGVSIASGRTVPAAGIAWPGPKVDSFGYATLAEALAAPPRDNREGLVVHFAGTDDRIKIKYAEYVALHRVVTGLNARVVWEALVEDGFGALVERLPDEFHDWARSVSSALHEEVAVAATGIEAAYAEILATLPEGWTRKDFALAAAGHSERGCLFLRLDNRDYRPMLWQRVKPAADWTPAGRVFGEENA